MPPTWNAVVVLQSTKDSSVSGALMGLHAVHQMEDLMSRVCAASVIITPTPVILRPVSVKIVYTTLQVIFTHRNKI